MNSMVAPQNIDAEINILGCLINDKSKLDQVINFLELDDFYLTKHKTIFKVIKALDAKGDEIDLVTISNFISQKNLINNIGGISYLTELSNAALYTSNIFAYAKIIKDKANRRKLIQAGREIIEKSYSDGDLDEIVSNVEDRLLKAMCKTQEDDPVEISEAINNALVELQEKHKNGGKIQGVTTGFKDIDKTISGLKKGDFVILAARPSMGKTAFALNIGQCASREAKVAMFSLEMSETQLVNRLLSARSLVDLGDIQNGSLNQQQFDKVAMAAADLACRKIHIDDKSMTINEIESKCKTLKRKTGLDVVIIDYLQLVEGSDRNSSREQEVAKISRKLKKLAMQLGITVIALSQLSRAPEQRADHRPMLSDLRESGSIEQDADVIIFLYRDEYYNKDSDDRNVAEVILGKNRNGEVRTIKLGWAGQFQRFTAIDWNSL